MSSSYLSEMLTTSIEEIKAKDKWKQHCWTMYQRSSWFESAYWVRLCGLPGVKSDRLANKLYRNSNSTKPMSAWSSSKLA